MINFVIYEDEEYFDKLYEDIIHKFMGKSDDQYKIYHFAEYNQNLVDFIKSLTGQNIYIFDIEVKGKSGLDLAREIRNLKKTMNDQIIIATAHQDLIQNAFHKKIFMVDFISKFDELEDRLMLCFHEIYEIFNSNNFLSFKQDSEIVRIPYNDILFIEKDKYDECLYIETINDKFKYRGNIAKIEKILKNDKRFFRVHRSCIVNTFKITKINTSIPAIYFNDKYTNCLSRDKKKELEELCLLGLKESEQVVIGGDLI